MEKELFGIPNLEVYLVLGTLAFFGLLETFSGHLRASKRTFGDWIQEVGSFFALSVLIKPFIVLAVLTLGSFLFPDQAGILSGQAFWWVFPLYLLVDDVLQYWYHRSAHEYPFLWKLHRTHHQAEEMGFFVSYRNAALYYLLMPNIWWVGIITFLGGGAAVALGLVLKQMVIIGSHSTKKWDAPLYKIPVLRDMMTVVERIIVTPAFHHAHHGRSKVDGVSDPNGNFGNMFSIWDQLFGSALFTRKFPTDYGLMNDPKEHWSEAYLHPFVKTKNPNSELSSSYMKEKTTTSAPIKMEVEKGKAYAWCQCGFSKNQPFCDGSHQGTKHTPMRFVAEKDGPVWLCNCKETKNSPFCDGTHKQL